MSGSSRKIFYRSGKSSQQQDLTSRNRYSDDKFSIGKLSAKKNNPILQFLESAIMAKKAVLSVDEIYFAKICKLVS